MKSRFITLLAGSLAAFLLNINLHGQAVAMTFTNGGFEDVTGTPLPPNSNQALNPGDTWLTGWTVGGPGGDILVINGAADGLVPDEGSQWILFNGGDTPPGGTLSQTFATGVGQTYAITFALAQSGSGDSGLTAIVQASDGAVLATNRYVPIYGGPWKQFQLSFNAVTTNTTLVLRDTSIDTGNVDLALDDVTVSNLSGAPVITSQPVSQTAPAGSNVTFSVAGVGSPFTLQWYFASAALSQATNGSLTVTAATNTAGNYVAVLSNSAGTATSAVAVLTLSVPPPSASFFTNGGFETVSGTPLAPNSNKALNPGDTWLPGWTAGGPGGDILVVNGATDGLVPDEGAQWILFNAGNTPPGGVLSQSFTTGVGQSYSITFALAQSGSGDSGLTALVQASDGTVLATNRYVPVYGGPWKQFQFSFTALTTNTTLVLTDTSGSTAGADLALDNVTVTNLSGAPVISTQPVSQTAAAGSNVVFNVAAQGSPFTIQWYFGAAALPQATNASLLVTAGASTAGNYFAVASNSFGTATSAVAVLTLSAPPPPASSFTNGGFETVTGTPLSANSNRALNPGDTWLTGWTAGGPGGDILIVNGAADGLVPDEGSQWVLFNGGNSLPGGILSQTFATTAGQDSTVTFALAQSGSGDSGLTAVVRASDGTVLATNRYVPLYGGPWKQFQFSFTALTATSTLILTDTSGSTAGADLALDNVTVGMPPIITLSPSNQSVTIGSTATFTGAAGGSGPLGYQWQFDGTNIVGATNTSLTLTNVQAGNAGSYQIVASNSSGSTTSSAATLTVNETTLEVDSAAGAGGQTVVVSIDLSALGTESAVGFSLDFDPTILAYMGTVAGSGASGGILLVNSNQMTSGFLGLAVAMPSGTFAPGRQQLVQVSFQVEPVTNSTDTVISFGSQPTSEQVSDSQANSLPTVYSSGVISISRTSVEGDVSPRTNGDGIVSITDWVQEGRFVAGLDTISNSGEFQRADCAPRSTLGDGAITVADWVQVGRYAVGLDPMTVVGGPAGPPSGGIAPHGHNLISSTTPISIVPLTQGGSSSSVAVQLVAQGTENALSFSVNYDRTRVRFLSGKLAGGVSGAVLFQNTNQESAGNLGFVIGLTPPNTFVAGTQQLVDLSFAAIYYSNTTTVVFGDSPVTRQLVDANANVMPASYQNATLSLSGTVWPALTISPAGTNVVLSWPTAAAEFSLETVPLFGTNWNPIATPPINIGNSLMVTSSVTPTTGFFRLRLP